MAIEQIRSYEVEIKGVNSVKELKQEISDLRDKLVKLDKTSEEYKQTVTDLITDETKLKDVLTAGKNEVNASLGSYNALVNEMSALKKVWREVTDETTRADIGKRIADINSQLKEMDASLGNYQRNVGNYPNAMGQVFANQRQELSALKTALDNLDPSSKEYADAFARASEITHNLSERQEQLKLQSTDLGDQMSNIVGIGSNLAAGFSACNSVMGLFGEESEDVQKAMLKVQQSMALVQGLQGLDGFIKRTEGLSTAMKSWIKRSTEAKVATEGTTVAQKGLNKAMLANPVGIIIALLTLLISNWKSVSKYLTEVFGGQEKVNGVMEDAKVIFTGVGNVITKFIITPLKLAIDVIASLGKTVYNLAKGDWKGAWNSMKDGFNDVVDDIKDGYDVIGNYAEASADKRRQIEEEHRKKVAEEYVKEKDEYIKDMNAKKDADWKYTEESKKFFEEYYKKKMEMYDKDSEEYRQAQRDMWQYNKDYQNRIEKAEEDAKKKRSDNYKKSIEEAKKTAKEIRDFETEIAQLLGGTTNSNKQLQNWKKDIDEKYKAYKETLKRTSDDAWDITAKLAIAKKAIEEAYYEKADKGAFDNILNEITKVEKEYESLISELESGFNSEKIMIGIDFPEGELSHIKSIFSKTMEELNEEMELITDRSAFFTEGTEAWKEMEQKKTEITNKMIMARLEAYQKEADIFQRILEKQTSNIEHSANKEINDLENSFNLYVSEEGSAFNRLIWNRNNYLTQMHKGWEKEDKIYEIRRNALNDELSLYKEAMNNMSLTYDQRLEAQKNFTQLSMELENIEVDHTIECNERKTDAYKRYFQATQDTLNGVSDIFGNVADAMQTNIEMDIANGKISEEEGEKRFESVKKFQKAQAIVNAFASANGAYEALASIPYVGPALGAIAAATALASGIANAKAIENTTLNSSTSASGGNSFVLPSVLETEPTMVSNVTNESDTDTLANSITKSLSSNPLKAYVVESDISTAQNRSAKRTSEATF